jgi:RNA polymerase sigma-70 factor (sigma-E family)
VASPDPGPYEPDFDAYVRSHGQRLARAAFLLTGDTHLAEDLVQTALAKVAGRFARIAASGDPTPYVRTVLVRTALSWRRRRWRGEVPTAPLPDRATERAGGHEERVAQEALRAALLALAPRQRACVVLRYYEDLPEAEVARLLGCSPGTVKSQTSKALAHLRQSLAGSRSGPLDPSRPLETLP